jgi:hypothetical protein|tara:strand:- start:447 stop:1271 length:825 start_codon:yes stop_codon:yes gene_type:complete
MLPVPDVDARRHGSTMNAHAIGGWLVMVVLLLAAAASVAVVATGGEDRLLAVSIGDSVAFDADPGIRAALESTGGIRVDTRSFGGVGLLQSGFDGYLDEALRDGPDVVVVMLGGWDLGEILSDTDAYGRRLDQVADRMLDRGATVIWLGMPPTPPSEGIEEARDVANRQFEALAGRRERVLYLDSGQALGGPDGGFTRFRIGLAGLPVQVRKVREGRDDGHLCPGGAALLGDLVLAALRATLEVAESAEGWWKGDWTGDARYDDPPGGCEASTG